MASDPHEAEVFARTWADIARAAEDGLSDPAYPDDSRATLYELLAAARECAENGIEA
jgi:hypothetical protein